MMRFITLIALCCLCCLGNNCLLAQSKTANNPKQDIVNALEWRNIGPFRGGRSCAVTGVAGKPNLYYFGSTGGGVWKTENGGHHWENISDGYFGGSIGAVSVAESDPNVIYVGGGEKTVRGNVSFGYGVWKTENGGKTWKSVGLDKSRHIPRIRIHPKNHNIVYAAVLGDLYKGSTERGVYKSTNGGDTWKRVLFANADAGAVDLIIDPTNTRNLYATTWNVRRTPYSLSSGGDGSALWKSTDGGETWTNISTKKGLPKGLWGISGITVSPVNGDRLWAIIENQKGGVYRSDDGGETWAMTNDSRALRQRAWYYTRIYADTQDEDMVYVMNVNYHKSTDGGKSFESKRAPHGDHHDLWIAPEDNKRMIIGDDGGAQVSFDGGDRWSTYHNQPTSQFYRVTTDNHFPYRIYVAQQDNSAIRINSRSFGGAITEDDWESTAGGESAHIAVDPTDDDIVYGGSYGGFLTRKDHRTGVTNAVNVWPDNPMGYGAEGMKYRFQWNFPIFFSKHDPKKLYAGSNHLHLSTDEGKSWKLISPDLTRNDTTKLGPSGGPITKDNTSVEYYCTIFAGAESPKKAGVIWVGSDDGLIHVTQDGGENWDNVTSNKMPKWLMINSIEPDPFDEAGCYVAGTLYKAGDYAPYLYKTSDYGKTWKKIVTGIGAEHFTRVLRADPKQSGLLYAGTETGMYISYNDGANWSAFQGNLPIVPITDLAIKDNDLIAATQGRSIWIFDDLNILRSLSSGSAAADIRLLETSDALRIPGRQNKKVTQAGMNAPSGASFNIYIKKYDEKDSVNLTVLTATGDTIRKMSNHAKEKSNKLELESGLNRVSWNLKYEDAHKFDGMILWWGSMSGAKAVPGDYRYDLDYNGKAYTKSFKVLPDPRLSLTDADYQSQFDYISGINRKVTEAHKAIEQMRSVKSDLSDYKSKMSDNKAITMMITAVDSTLSVIENELYQTKNRSRQDPLNYPIKLTNKLAHLNSLAQISDAPPTSQAIVVRDELIARIDAQLADYKAVLDNDIPKLNEMIRDAQVDAITIPKE